MSEHRITYVTAPIEVAEQIATTLVEDGLVVCVNIVEQVRTIYKWEGSVEKSYESLMIIKTAADKTDELIDKVKEIHPYEVPEVISFDITAGNQDYLDWLSGKEIVVEETLLDDEDVDEDEDEDEEEEEKAEAAD